MFYYKNSLSVTKYKTTRRLATDVTDVQISLHTASALQPIHIYLCRAHKDGVRAPAFCQEALRNELKKQIYIDGAPNIFASFPYTAGTCDHGLT